MTLASNRIVYLRDQPIIEDTVNQPPMITWDEVASASTALTNTPQQTNSFSPRAKSLVIVCAGWGTAFTQPTSTVIDSLGNNYTLMASIDAKNTTQVWSHYYSSAPGPMTLTITPSDAEHGGVAVVRSLLHCAPVQNGAIATAGDTNQQVELTANLRNVVYGVATNWNDSTAPSPALPSTRTIASYGLTDGFDGFSVFTSRTVGGIQAYGYPNNSEGVTTVVEIVHV